MRVRVVLVRPLYDLNIGMVARSMKNFGFHDLYIVSDRRPGFDAVKFASHASDIVEAAVVVDDLEDAVKGVDLVIGTTGKVGGEYNVLRTAVPIWELRRLLEGEGAAAILFGPEDIGLRNEELARCDLVATIPASPEYPILNLSHAVAITLYELSRGRVRHFRFKLAGDEERGLILRFFREAVKLAGVKSHRVDSTVLIMRHILSRSFMSKREAYGLIGAFRKMRDSLQRCLSRTT